jgi:hypothetical protein
MRRCWVVEVLVTFIKQDLFSRFLISSSYGQIVVPEAIRLLLRSPVSRHHFRFVLCPQRTLIKFVFSGNSSTSTESRETEELPKESTGSFGTIFAFFLRGPEPETVKEAVGSPSRAVELSKA